jgi:hypothetical protein
MAARATAATRITGADHVAPRLRELRERVDIPRGVANGKRVTAAVQLRGQMRLRGGAMTETQRQLQNLNERVVDLERQGLSLQRIVAAQSQVIEALREALAVTRRTDAPASPPVQKIEIRRRR